MFPTKKYQCFCKDCNHTFSSDKMPFKQRSVFSRLFGKKCPRIPAPENAKHCGLAFSEEELNDEKSTVRCPKCGGQHVMLV